jgi:hypothetical protein
MVLHVNRRWLRLVTALLFTIGGMAQACAMPDAAIKMPSTAMEAAASDHDMDCGGGADKAMDAACVALCATAVAILGEPVAIPLLVGMPDIMAVSELPSPSAGPSPEPHPPKR